MTTSDAAGPVLLRDHRDEHEGCKVMWPWLRWCSRYRYASQLVGYALIDVDGMSMSDFKWAYGWCKDYDEVQRKRDSARSAYISHRERWDEDDIADVKTFVSIMKKHIGHEDLYFEGRTEEQEFESQWQKRQEKKAYVVLWAYDMINKKTGQIELDNLKKLR